MKSETLPYWGWGDMSQRMFRHEWTHTSCRLYCPLCLQWLQSLSGPSAFLPLGFCLLQLIKNQKIEKFGNEASVVACLISLQAFSSGTQVPENKLTPLGWSVVHPQHKLISREMFFPMCVKIRGSSWVVGLTLYVPDSLAFRWCWNAFSNDCFTPLPLV